MDFEGAAEVLGVTGGAAADAAVDTFVGFAASTTSGLAKFNEDDGVGGGKADKKFGEPDCGAAASFLETAWPGKTDSGTRGELEFVDLVSGRIAGVVTGAFDSTTEPAVTSRAAADDASAASEL
jgi:hypothetical protein